MSLLKYILQLADTNLILTQRNAAWCGHGPILEQDIAITNITLDLIGQARNLYQYAATLQEKITGEATTEDKLAYHRNEREFYNLLLVEQENGDWGQTIMRQFFYAVYQFGLYEKLKTSPDAQLAAIATKSIKETAYHLNWCSEWVIRLGDGTKESKQRMEKAIEQLWPYTGEMFIPAAYEDALAKEGIIPEINSLKENWLQKVKEVFEEATLTVPEIKHNHKGGKTGVHTEKLGYILAEMQYLPRMEPEANW